MSNRIADLRTPVANLDQARETFQAIALASKRLAVAEARYERARADLAARYEEETQGRRAAVNDMTADLAAWISANREKFINPRTIKSELGEFGLRTVTELIVHNESGLIDLLMEKGYDDCYAVVRKLVKPALMKRIKAGEPILHCTSNTGDTVVCKVSKTVIEEAVSNLEE
jgi:hypothetical protein